MRSPFGRMDSSWCINHGELGYGNRFRNTLSGPRSVTSSVGREAYLYGCLVWGELPLWTSFLFFPSPETSDLYLSSVRLILMFLRSSLARRLSSVECAVADLFTPLIKRSTVKPDQRQSKTLGLVN